MGALEHVPGWRSGTSLSETEVETRAVSSESLPEALEREIYGLTFVVGSYKRWDCWGAWLVGAAVFC